MKSLYPGQKPLNADLNLQLAIKIREEGCQVSRKRMIEGNAGFAYRRAISYSRKNKDWPHIQDDDILQAAMLGLILAVDKYDHRKGHMFTTYAHWWILKHITENIYSQHWNTTKPPNDAMRRFLYRKAGVDESGQYIDKYMTKHSPVEISSHEDGYIASDILDAVNRCGMNETERRVFDALYGDNLDKDRLDDLGKSEILDLESAALEKLKGQFE